MPTALLCLCACLSASVPSEKGEIYVRSQSALPANQRVQKGEGLKIVEVCEYSTTIVLLEVEASPRYFL